MISCKFNANNTTSPTLGESRGLVVKGEDSQLSGCGFEPRRRILDGVSEASFYIVKREIKVAKWGTPKKIFYIAHVYCWKKNKIWNFKYRNK